MIGPLLQLFLWGEVWINTVNLLSCAHSGYCAHTHRHSNRWLDVFVCWRDSLIPIILWCSKHGNTQNEGWTWPLPLIISSVLDNDSCKKFGKGRCVCASKASRRDDDKQNERRCGSLDLETCLFPFFPPRSASFSLSHQTEKDSNYSGVGRGTCKWLKEKRWGVWTG